MVIEELDLTVRSYQVLRRHGITEVSSLIDMTRDELLSLRNLGRLSLEDIEAELRKVGLSLKE